MQRVLLPLDADDPLADPLARRLGARRGTCTWRRFPDGESLVAIDDALDGADVALLATLARPDDRMLPLLFAAATAREFGARRVGLVAPYLAYMRQDARFHPGEAISAPLFAGLIDGAFDWLVTVDPHLHRYRTLDALYRIPVRCIESAATLGRWIAANVDAPAVIGPDRESEQWAAAIAAAADAPWQVLDKTRRGDRDVSVSAVDAAALHGRTPVIVDDIVSSAHTMIETVTQLRRSGLPAPVCVGIHAVFAAGAHEALQHAGAARIVTTDTIRHPTNAISVADLLGDATVDVLAGTARED